MKVVNSLSHYTDWNHSATSIPERSAGSATSPSRALLPRAVALEEGSALFAQIGGLAFWISTIGIGLHLGDVGLRHHAGLMWRAYTALGFLEYSFVETVDAMHPYYVIRAIGGGCSCWSAHHGLQPLDDGECQTRHFCSSCENA